MAKDYYEILGVKRGATDEEIRKAYRNLAKKHHPDVSKSPDAPARFAEVQEAYDVLSDPQKRRLYDSGGLGAGAGGGRGGVHTWSTGGPGVDLDAEELGEIFESFFGGRTDFRSGGGAGPRTRSAPRRRGDDIQHEVTVSFAKAVRGGKEKLTFDDGEQARTIEVTIPPGIADGARLRLRGEGLRGRGGGPRGDLIVVVSVGSHPLLRREPTRPLDLHIDLPLTVGEAMYGTKVLLPTLDGSVSLTVPPGSQGGQTLRLKGQGAKSKKGAGDLLAHIRIALPSPDDVDAKVEPILRSLGPKGIRGEGWPRE